MIPPGACAVRDYAPDAIMRAHAHDEATLCLLLRGHYVEHIRGRSALHRTGDIMFCPANEPHAQEIGTHGARKLLVAIRPAMLPPAAGTRTLADAPFVRSPAAAEAGRRLAAELANPDGFSGAIIEGCAMEMLRHLLRSDHATNRATDGWLRRVWEAVCEQLDRPVDLAALARIAGRHPATIARRFQAAYGCTPAEYQRGLRLDRAAALIAKGIPLAEVAQRTGFADQAHLTRTFRRARGITPGALRHR